MSYVKYWLAICKVIRASGRERRECASLPLEGKADIQSREGYVR
jgi:hypothetical protein